MFSKAYSEILKDEGYEKPSEKIIQDNWKKFLEKWIISNSKRDEVFNSCFYLKNKLFSVVDDIVDSDSNIKFFNLKIDTFSKYFKDFWNIKIKEGIFLKESEKEDSEKFEDAVKYEKEIRWYIEWFSSDKNLKNNSLIWSMIFCRNILVEYIKAFLEKYDKDYNPKNLEQYFYNDEFYEKWKKDWEKALLLNKELIEIKKSFEIIDENKWWINILNKNIYAKHQLEEIWIEISDSEYNNYVSNIRKKYKRKIISLVASVALITSYSAYSSSKADSFEKTKDDNTSLTKKDTTENNIIKKINFQNVELKNIWISSDLLMDIFTKDWKVIRLEKRKDFNWIWVYWESLIETFEKNFWKKFKNLEEKISFILKVKEEVWISVKWKYKNYFWSTSLFKLNAFLKKEILEIIEKKKRIKIIQFKEKYSDIWNNKELTIDFLEKKFPEFNNLYNFSFNVAELHIAEFTNREEKKELRRILKIYNSSLRAKK